MSGTVEEKHEKSHSEQRIAGREIDPDTVRVRCVRYNQHGVAFDK